MRAKQGRGVFRCLGGCVRAHAMLLCVLQSLLRRRVLLPALVVSKRWRYRRKRSHATVARMLVGHHLYDVMRETADAVIRTEDAADDKLSGDTSPTSLPAPSTAAGRPIDLSAAASAPLLLASSKWQRASRKKQLEDADEARKGSVAQFISSRISNKNPLFGRAVSFKQLGTRPARQGDAPDICIDCAGCVLCRGSKAALLAKSARVSLQTMSSVATALMAVGRLVSSSASVADASTVSHVAVMYGSAIALRTGSASWLSVRKDCDVPVLVQGRAPRSSCLFVILSAGRPGYNGNALYTDGIWLKSLDGRLLSTRLQARAPLAA